MPPAAGNYGGAHYGPILYHLLPFIDQKPLWSDATWYDPGVGAGSTTPNNSVDGGVLFPCWESTIGPNAKGVLGGFLKMTRVPTYQCPTDPTIGMSKLGGSVPPFSGNDWGDGDGSYSANYMCFGRFTISGTNPTFPSPNISATGNQDTVWDGKATLQASYPDGTSNTIMWAERYARCDGSPDGSIGGCWWMRECFRVTA